MDRVELQRNADSLRHQLNIQRVPISQSATALRQFIEEHQAKDPLVNPVDKRENPWAEKSKCEIL